MVSGGNEGRREEVWMILLIDMDNVVADLMKKWLATYNAEYDDNLTPDKITSWAIESHASKCSPREFHAIIERAEFFADLDVFADAIDVTGRLQSFGHELYFVTATPYDNPTAGFDKNNWAQKYFPHIGRQRVIQTHHKHMVKGDLLFDDSPVNLQHFPGIKVAMDFPYNKNVAVNYRVSNWLEFEKIVNQLTDFRKHFRR